MERDEHDDRLVDDRAARRELARWIEDVCASGGAAWWWTANGAPPTAAERWLMNDALERLRAGEGSG